VIVATLALGFLLSAPATATATKATKADVAGVKAAHEKYRQALLAKDGAAAAAAVDRETVAYYGRMRELALDADAATVKKQSVVDKLMILRLRQQVGRAAIEGMDGAKLLAYGVEKGWIDSSSVQQAELGAVTVEGDSAAAELKLGGRVAPPEYSWRFKREGGVWRVSLMPLLRMAEPAIQQAVKQSGLDDDAFVLAILEKVSGQPVPETVWQPLRPAGEQKPAAGAKP
jgi:hypothetical protein